MPKYKVTLSQYKFKVIRASSLAVAEERAEKISNVTYTAPDEQGQAQQVQQAQAEFQRGLIAPVGRNEPCPCGSGKKYKFCHGKLA